MIIHMVEGATDEQTERVIDRIVSDYGLQCQTMVGAGSIVIGVKGMAGIIDEGRVTELPGVDRVIRITEKYKDASRNFHHEDTIVDVNGTLVGGGSLTIFGGPCAIESEDQAVESAVMARDAGVDILRAFVDKSRTSPYDYRGLEIAARPRHREVDEGSDGPPRRLRIDRPAPSRGVPRCRHRRHPDRGAKRPVLALSLRSSPASARRSCSSTASATT